MNLGERQENSRNNYSEFIVETESLMRRYGLRDEEIVDATHVELRDILRDVNEEDTKLIKRRRRMLKNRVYAQISRNRRRNSIDRLTKLKRELEREIEALEQQITIIQNEIESMLKKLGFSDIDGYYGSPLIHISH